LDFRRYKAGILEHAIAGAQFPRHMLRFIGWQRLAGTAQIVENAVFGGGPYVRFGQSIQIVHGVGSRLRLGPEYSIPKLRSARHRRRFLSADTVSLAIH